jgi:hypothetical protein
VGATATRLGITLGVTVTLLSLPAQVLGTDGTAPGKTALEPVAPLAPPAPPVLDPAAPPKTTPGSSTQLALRPPLAPPEKYPFRAILETTLALGGGFIWYWWNEDFNSRDWDLGWDRGSWKRKLTFQALAFDNNEFDTNATSHPKAGVSYYIIGRGNNLSMAESLLLSVGASTVWEYFVEYREVPSVNDLVITPLCGLSIGEPIYQFSRFFARSAGGLVTDTLAGVLSPISTLNDLIDNEDELPARTVGSDGLASDNVHRFDLRVGLASAVLDGRDRRTEIDYRIEGYLNNVPGYLAPGAFRRRIYAGEVSQLAARLATSSGRVVGADFESRTNYFGWGAQNFEGTNRADLRGWAGGWALGTAFEYWMRQRDGAPRDELLLANLIGGTAELVLRRGPLRFRIRDRTYFNFGMIHSLAYEAAAGRADLAGTKSVLQNHGYYYAFGGTHLTEVVLGYRALDLGLEGRVDRFYSIEGLDRTQGTVTNDFSLVDRRETARTWLSLRPRKGFAEISVELEVLRRTGTLPGLSLGTTERRGQLSFSLVWS